jgi:hypothetical protein
MRKVFNEQNMGEVVRVGGGIISISRLVAKAPNNTNCLIVIVIKKRLCFSCFRQFDWYSLF